MQTEDLLSEPTFIPKIMDGLVVKSGIDFPIALIDATTVVRGKNVFNEAKEKIPNIIIDPVTHYIQFEESRNKQSFKKLPYSSVNDLQKIYADPTYRLEEFVKPVLEFQRKNGSCIQIAPYLCSDDINSTVFSTNLTMLGETIYLRGENEQPPLFAPICIGSHILADNKLVSFVVDHYKDAQINDKFVGYFILINDLDDRHVNEEILAGLSSLVYQLSRDKKVIVNRLGGFGEMLNIIGSDAFSSSLAGGESFSIKNLQINDPNIRGRNHNLWMYIPELFDYVNEYEAKKINYECDCPACSNTLNLETKFSQRKIHFLYKRMDSIRELAAQKKEDRHRFMLNRLQRGIDLAHEYISKFGSDLNYTHMAKWKKTLETSSTWNFEEDNEELEKLLNDLD